MYPVYPFAGAVLVFIHVSDNYHKIFLKYDNRSMTVE